MGVTAQQIISLLENVLFETATQAAVNEAAWEANPAATSISSLATAMANSGEEKIAATIVGYYLSALARAPSAAEIRYYMAIAEQGLTQSQIAAGQVSSATWDTIASYFAHSPEFITRGGLDSTIGFNQTALLLQAVPWLYTSVLGRTPDTAEISYYDTLVVNGTSLSTLFRYFTSSPEFHTDTDTQIALALVNYGEAVASGQQPATVGATVTLGPPAPAPAPAPVPTTLSLTTGTDHLTAAASTQTFIATLGGGSPTLTANDSLHGSGNTLQITDTSGATSQDLIPSHVSLSGISTVTLTTSGNAGTDISHPFDLSGYSGITGFTLTSSGAQNDYIAAASTTAVTVHDATPILGVAGFASLSVTSNSLTTLDLSGSGGAISLTDPTGPTSLTINVSGLTLSADITDTSNHITAITIDGGTGATSLIDNTIRIGGYSITDGALTHLTVTGNVGLGAPLYGVNLPSTLTNFDSSNATGSVYLTYSGSGATFALGDNGTYLVDSGGNTITGTGDGAEIYTSGSGGETITFGNGNSTIGLEGDGGDTVSLGNGNNGLTLSGNSTGSTITFGTGNNTVTDSGLGGNTITFGSGTNSFTDSSTNGGNTVTFTTGDSTADFGHLTNDVVKVGVDAGYASPTTPNLVVKHIGSGDEIVLTHFSTISTEFLPGTLGAQGSPDNTISNLESILAGNHTGNAFALDQYGGDTFIVATLSGTLGAGDTTVIQLVGYTGTVSWSGSNNILHLT